MKSFTKILRLHRPAVFLAGGFYLVGIIGLLWLKHIPAVWYATGPFLMFTGVLLFLFHENARPGDWFAYLGVYFAGFFIEWLGTNTGWPFGSYSYGKILGPKVWNTPLLIGFNWLVLTYMVWAFLSGIIGNKGFKVILGSFMLVIYDFLLEPVAIYSGMWTWATGIPPLQNYLGWMAFSAIIFTFYAWLGFRPRNRLAPYLFLYQSLFFGILNIFIE